MHWLVSDMGCLHSHFSFLMEIVLGSLMRLSFYFSSLCFVFVDFSINSWNCVLDSIEFPYKLKNEIKDGVCTKKRGGGEVGVFGSPCVFQWVKKRNGVYFK